MAVCAVCAATLLGLLLCCWGDFCLGRADARLAHRDHARAAKWVERSRWLGGGTDARTCLLQVRIARRRHDFPELKCRLQQAAERGAPPREIQRERLLALAESGQFDAMQEHWPQLLSDQRDDGPDIARAYYNWSMLHHDLSRAEKALQLWHDDYPRDAEPLALLGRLEEAILNWHGAEDAYRQAFTLSPENDEYRLAFANALHVRLKTKEAVPIYQEYLHRHPDDLVALRGLAQCAAANGDLETARQLLRQALRAKPDDFAALKAYGEVLLSAGDASAAVTALEKAHRAVPEHANLAYTLARALKSCGRATEAEPLFAFVAESRPHLVQLLDLEKQLRRDPENLELRMKIASVTAKYVSRRDAIRWYETLLHVAPDYAPAREAVAELYELTGAAKLSTK
ncbi:MAG TPA: tetratricopeptide repeat protein [Planctomycetaceae bacterium]|jgi:tetratricopeptide (TPR) repeat protein